VGLVLVATGGMTVFALPGVGKELEAMDRPVKVTAHRGSSAEAPENTLAALRLAIVDGADFAEIDIQQAKDGTLVLLHDEDLSRVAGVDRPVWEMTGEELGALDVGSHFDRKFAGERVVTLDDAILTVKGHLDLNIEIKVHGHESKSFVADVVAAIRRHGFVADCVVTSLDQAALQEVKRLDPALRRGMIITAKLGAASDIDVDFYSVQPLIATVGFIQKAHDEGRDVHVWTLNTAETMRTFIVRGADNLITDRPRLAREILDARTDTDRLSDALARLFRRP
ncbi:MAG: glycerophosphodiester phosphodiesterase family protein, partial [Planctomycetota bacterium]